MNDNPNKESLKFKFHFIILISLVILLFILILNILHKTKSRIIAYDKPQIQETLSAEKREELLKSKDLLTQNLVSLSYSEPKLNKILNNINAYPKSLLKLAIRNSEAIDFVANYPERNKLNTLSCSNDFYNKKIPLFIQWDTKWGYDMYGDDFIALDGCGPTSLAMVVAGLTKNESITPKDVADYAYKNGYFVKGAGSSWNLMTKGASHYGLKSKEIPTTKQSILSTLKAGYPIIATVGPGTFTRKGHFLVLTGVTADNKITINDPNSKINSSKAWDIDVFLRESRNLWKMAKK